MKFTVTIETDEAQLTQLLNRMLTGAPAQPQHVTTADDGPLITREEYATYKNIVSKTVSKRFNDGVLKGKRIGRKIYIYKNQ